ncbi:hypothetical protein BLNAU_3081 [Blattamonas nauphoetae]|uniref:Uncharacterized protein n=1 Tax=Blattamonas nauphoetae TaxID=2049346 RepID=A0ABQ9YE88_9EUKA|nr:hypothetical protein BLNAU_3081 [Blattamonas nauphoetae]
MPPKHKLGRKRAETQSSTRTKRDKSSKSDKHIIHSTIPDSVKVKPQPSLDSLSISFAVDILTITDNDRHFVRVSKQILQYELKRKQMNVFTMTEQALLEGDEITLHTSTTSDWRLVLQDSITADALQQGYIIFTEEKNCRTKLPSALIKLVCHSSNRLRAVALAFFDVGIWNSGGQLNLTMAATGLLPQLFKCLKPHEIPLNRTTFEFHRHITSIMDNFFVRPPHSFDLQNHTSNRVDPIFQPFCNYLRHLIASPVSPTDCPSGISLFSKMQFYDENIKSFRNGWYHQNLVPIFSELRENMKDELASLLDLTTSRETLHQLLFGVQKRTDELGWAETFPSILVRLSEGRHLSDLGLQAFLLFMSNRPYGVKPVLQSDGTFSIEVDGKVQATLALPTPFINALIPTRPHFAAAFLTRFHWFINMIDSAALVRDLKCGWFSQLFEAANPSKLHFTNELIHLHKQLVGVMQDYIYRIQRLVASKKHDLIRSELNEICLSFHKVTKDYIVHLSLHPFALITKCNSNAVLDLLTKFFRPDFENSETKPFREKLRKDMDEAALSSSSPPFILTSELVCRLTDDEIMNVVDRIVALLESDSPISDDTILRICAFHTNQLKSVFLPELFRSAGRSTEQYFHALNSLLSLPLDHFDQHRINSLLSTKPKTLRPTLDEWDDVDLSTVGVVMPTIHQNSVTFNTASSQLLTYALSILPQMSHCASRLTRYQLERLLSPSIDLLFKFSFQQDSSDSQFRWDREAAFVELSRLCEQRVIVQCLSRIGFFSRIVDGLLDDDLFFKSKSVLDIFLHQPRYSGDDRAEKKMLRRRVHHFLEEGWQDVLDLLLGRKTTRDGFNYGLSRIMGILNHGYKRENQMFQQLGNIAEMMGFFGANLNRRMY